MNVPVALLGLVAVLTLVPESKAPGAPDLDVLGVLTSSAGLVALMYSLVEVATTAGAARALEPGRWPAWQR